ncbi:MAG: hypothetical protein ACPGR8_01210 [Limisphaerales bacterium]
MSADHELGIHGKLQHVLADANHTEATLCVHHVLGEDLSSTTHVTQDQLRKAANISHINLLNPTKLTIETINQSDGMAAVTIKGGDGSALPVTDRQCAHVNGSMLAAHMVALPGTNKTSDMAFKQLPTDKHNFVPHDAMSEEEKQRNKLNAAYYPAHTDVPSDSKLYANTITASHNGEDRIAIPLTEKVTPETGGLSAVASRCIKHQKKKPSDLCPSGNAQVVTMPHKTTGEDVEHLVADAAAVKAMADTVRANTAVKGTFAEGVVITSHGISEQSKPGDHIISKVTIHRCPTDETGKVTLQKDLMPTEVAGGFAPVAGEGPISGHNQKWHDAMFAKKKGAAGAVPQIAAEPDAQASTAENDD